MDEKNVKNEHRADNRKLASVFNEYIGEYRKVIWPSKKDLTKQTTTVILTTLLVGLIITGLDAVFALGLTFFSSLLS